MNATTTGVLSQSLSQLTYNADKIKTPKDNQLNIYMGIGLWSVKDGLSEGLPIDVMQMLLSATVLRSEIKEANPKEFPTIIILIADSMAVGEGAEREKVFELVELYKKSLKPFLKLLNIRDCTEIVLSSDLEKIRKYQVTRETIESSPVLQQIKAEDPLHYAYISTQTAITRYMQLHKEVGVKVGWISAASSKELNNTLEPKHLKNWDELKFDRWCEMAYPDSMQYLYTKAGLKQSQDKRHVNVSEGCPYTAYAKDQRYIIQTEEERSLSSICPLQKRVRSHWSGVAEICKSLRQLNIVPNRLIPKGCIQKTNDVLTVTRLLNHWLNLPVISPQSISTADSIQRKHRCMLL